MRGGFALWDTGGMFTVEIYYARVRRAVLCRRQEPAGGGPGVWASAEDGKQDAGLFLAAWVSAAETGEAAQAGGLARCHRRYFGRRQAAAEEAAAHGQADLRASSRPSILTRVATPS